MKRIWIIFSIFLLFVFVLDPSAKANETGFEPVKMICGSIDSDDKTFQIIEFDVNRIYGFGSAQDKLAKTYSKSSYPLKDYRITGLRDLRFRLAVTVLEQAYSKGQFQILFSIYEEKGESLLQRHFSSLTLGSLKNAYRFSYEIPDAQGRISCHVYLKEEVAKARSSKLNPRKPAQK